MSLMANGKELKFANLVLALENMVLRRIFGPRWDEVTR